MQFTIICHDCDLLLNVPDLPMGLVAECPRCGAFLRRTQFNSINRTLGWVGTGLILYVVAVSFPFLSMTAKGMSKTTALTGGIVALFQQGMPAMGGVVLITCLLAPLLSMLSLLYVLAPLRLRYRLPWAAHAFAWYLRLRSWSMMEVYMLGILISMVKLTKLARIVPGPSLYSFIALIFVLAASSVSLDSHLVWSKLAKARRVHQDLFNFFCRNNASGSAPLS